MESESTSSVAKSGDYKAMVDTLDVAFGHAKAQFEKSKKELKTWLYIWGAVSIISIAALIIYAKCMLNNGYSAEWEDREFYYNIIFRVLIGTGILTLVSFSIKMLRSHLHLYQFTVHKNAIVNSMSSLIGSCEGEVRAKIQSKLVEIITNFGNSGLEKKEKSELNLKAFESFLKQFENKEG